MTGLRSVLPLEREYRLRALLSTGGRGLGGPTIVHIASWKTASQWVRMVMSDPQLMRATGYEATYVRGRTGASGLHAALVQLDRLLTPVYATAATDLLADEHRIFAVVREPVALARSWHRANTSGHPSNDEVDRRRKQLAGETSDDPIDHLRTTLSFGFDETLEIGATWITRAQSNSNVRIVRFEDLTDPSRAEHELRAIFDHVGFAAQAELAPRLLERYRSHRIARVERLLRPPTERKYGQSDTRVPTMLDAVPDETIAAVLSDLYTAQLEPFRLLYRRNGS